MSLATPVFAIRQRAQRAALVLVAAMLAACGGGGGSGGAATPTNTAPSVNAGSDQNVEQNSSVSLTGTAMDDGGAAGLSYTWSQTGGPAVTIVNGDMAAASFIAPATNDFVVLEFQLTVSDGSLTSNDTIVVTVFDDIGTPLVQGRVTFEFVPGSGSGLAYSQTVERPVRGATVQVVNSTNSAVVVEDSLDDDGRFSFAVPANTDVFVRVRAELKQAGQPGWDVEVRDNTSSTTLPLNQRPLYVLDGQVFNTGAGPQNVSLVARSGWGGSSYTSVRASGPFAILDTIYSAIQLVVSADSDVVFAPLDAFWSVNNSTAGSTGEDPATGEIGTSFYRGNIDSLFLVGAANDDTDEFDSPVVAHEWGHYFEDVLARSDSVGGQWTLNERLDPRTAFGEGWGDAVAGMVLNDPLYYDTSGAQQDSGFSFSVDSNATSAANRGFYSARSIQAIIWDLFDSTDDATDTVSLGFGPIYDVLVNEQANGVPFTTIYPLLEGLRNREPAAVPAIETLVSAQRIKADADAFGTGETNDASAGGDVLPVYTEIVVGGPPVNVCSSNRFDPDEFGNRLGIRRFARFEVPAAGSYTIQATTTNPPASGQSDPDIAIFQVGFVAAGFSGVANSETLVTTLAAGQHVMEIYEYSYLRGDVPAISQPNDNTCFDLTISP
ncbi:MAG: hypothetical protein AAFX75_04120 [Pseudomonadota bacterium]